MKLWPEYFELLMKFEGEKYENDPDDPGNIGDGSPGNWGTKFGIDARSHPGVNIKALTKKGAEDIYLKEYFQSFSHKLPEPLCYVVYDLRVNAGEARAVKTMQKVLGVTVDGIVGPKTLDALGHAIDDYQVGLTKAYTEERINFYEWLANKRPTMRKYLRGWISRAVTLDLWAGKWIEKN
jgi:lysozyme family protein